MSSPTVPVMFTVTADWWSVGDPSLSGVTSAPSVMPVSGLVSFSPRIPRGLVAYTSGFQVASDVDCVQTITLLGEPDTGSWVLGYGGYSTGVMPYNASPSEVQSALVALTSIGTGNVGVAQGQDSFQYLISFIGALGNMPIDALTWDDSQLTSSVGNVVEITGDITTPGSTLRIADTGIIIPTRSGRIWAGRLSSIDVEDSVGVELVSNDPALNLVDQNLPSLIYDVTFSQVTYNAGTGVMQNFAFAAPPDDTPVTLTDPAFPRLSWQPPVAA